MLLLRLLVLAVMKVEVILIYVMNCGLKYRCRNNPNGERDQRSIHSIVYVTTKVTV